MKNIILFILVFLNSSSIINAETSTNIKINNNYSSNSDSQVKSSTEIYIHENGKVTSYASDKPENIEINTKNGNSEIKVNNENKNSLSPSPTDKNEVSKNVKQTDNEFNKNFVKKLFFLIQENFKFIDKFLGIF